MAIPRRPVRDRPDAIPLSIVDLAPWGVEAADPAPRARGDGGETGPPLPRSGGGPGWGQQGLRGDGPRADASGLGESGLEVGPRRRQAPPRGTARTAGPGRARRRDPDAPQVTDNGAALSRAFGALAARAHSVRDMDARLGRAGFAPQAVEGAVARLQELGYLDDPAFANAWVATRRAHRLHGTMRLRHDLARHGIDDATIEVAIADDGHEEARAAAVAARAVVALAGMDRATATRRLARQLARRGFPSGVTSRVVRATVGGRGATTTSDDESYPDETADVE